MVLQEVSKVRRRTAGPTIDLRFEVAIQVGAIGAFPARQKRMRTTWGEYTRRQMSEGAIFRTPHLAAF